MQKTNKNGIELIRAFESFSAEPYICAAGWPTIGYGHVIPSMKHDVITEAEAEILLASDLRKAENAVNTYIGAPLTGNQFSALVSFTFNLGAGALQRSTLRKVVNRGDHELIAYELRKWIYGGGRKLNGLLRRRIAEGELYNS